MNGQSFVVLRHELGTSLRRTNAANESVHLDWMFRRGDALWTWATPVIDRFDQLATFLGQRLGDHRLAYLDYEGEVSGNRGFVRRVLRGSYRTIVSNSDRFEVEMHWRNDNWGDEKGTTIAHLICQRIMTESDWDPEATPDAWSMSLSPGRYETN